jgi:hypothetical protein
MLVRLSDRVGRRVMLKDPLSLAGIYPPLVQSPPDIQRPNSF